MSVVCLVASMAVIAAKLQSVSIYEDKQFVSIEWWAFSCLSFAMILATVTSMIGLSNNRNFLLLPHLFLLFVFCLFAARVLLSVVFEFDFSEPNWTFRIAVLALAEIFLFCSLFCEFHTLKTHT
nr:Protein Y51H7BR.4, isoform a [Haemonchus contortus]